MSIAWDVPASWGTKKLGDIAPEDSSQIRPSDFPNETFNYWGLDAIDKGVFEEPLPNYVQGTEISSTCVKFTDSHVLYCKLRPYLNKVILPSVSGIGSTEWVPLKADPGQIDRAYLAYVLRTQKFVHYAEINSSGARMPRMRKSALWEADIPIPFPDEPGRSLNVQRRIIARIEALFTELHEIRGIHESIVSDTNKLMEAFLSELFPLLDGPMPEGWLLKTVKDISNKPQYGYTQSSQSEPIGPKFLRITDIQKGRVDWATVPYCECDDKCLDKYQLKRNDIVFARSGATTGKTFLIKDSPGKSVFASYLIRLQVKDIVPDYVYWFFQSPQYWQQVIPIGAAIPNMNATVLQGVKIPVPNNELLQKQIVARLIAINNEIDEMISGQVKEANSLQQLETSILSQAFRGEL